MAEARLASRDGAITGILLCRWRNFFDIGVESARIQIFRERICAIDECVKWTY
jgi:hypothetical protein